MTLFTKFYFKKLLEQHGQDEVESFEDSWPR